MSTTATPNKVKYNLKNVYVAKLTETVSSGVTSYSYATHVALPGAVSLSLSAEGETKPFYADGIVYYRSVANNGYSGDLEIAFVPDWFRKDILGETEDTNKVLVENISQITNTPFALLFEFDGDVRSIRHVLYHCTASRPALESQTKEDGIEPVTEKLTLAADPRSDGLVKAKTGDETTSTVYAGWFSSVYVINGNAPSGSGGGSGD